MGKRGGKKKGSESTSGQHTPMSIRQEISGRKQNNSLKSITKLQHLKNVALWASGEGSVPSLGVLLGRRFAACGEALGIPPDPSLFPCQKCETILQPGFNCTVRVVKNGEKTRRRPKKPLSATQNSVIYKCNFCTYDNLKRGTPKGHMKEICPPKAKQPSKPKPAESARKKQANSVSGEDAMKKGEVGKLGETALPSAGNETPSVAENSTTPLKALTLLDTNKRKRSKAKPKKEDELEAKSAVADAKGAGLASGKRRRKCWTTLKEIAENNERERTKTFSTFSIPFTL